MTIRVLMFAGLADRLGVRETSLSLPDGADVASAMAALQERYAPLAELRGRLALAVNLAYVRPEHALVEGDELALIPPVSGG